jgi:hypothetical protein
MVASDFNHWTNKPPNESPSGGRTTLDDQPASALAGGEEKEEELDARYPVARSHWQPSLALRAGVAVGSVALE